MTTQAPPAEIPDALRAWLGIAADQRASALAAGMLRPVVRLAEFHGFELRPSGPPRFLRFLDVVELEVALAAIDAAAPGPAGSALALPPDPCRPVLVLVRGAGGSAVHRLPDPSPGLSAGVEGRGDPSAPRPAPDLFSAPRTFKMGEAISQPPDLLV